MKAIAGDMAVLGGKAKGQSVFEALVARAASQQIVTPRDIQPLPATLGGPGKSCHAN